MKTKRRYNLADRRAALAARRDAVTFLRSKGYPFKAIGYALGTTRNVVETIWHREQRLLKRATIAANTPTA